MISWLNGVKIEDWKNGAHVGLIISCSGVGYDVQLLNRDLKFLNKSKELTLWIHQINKEESSYLIGFLEKADRDLFRKLISVNGIGSQIAINLLEGNNASQLISAINQKDIVRLIACPGIGKRTAERLVLELENKLTESESIRNRTINSLPNRVWEIKANLKSDVKSTLKNLDYKESEIQQALKNIDASLKSKSSEEQDIILKSLDFETLLKQALSLINTETGSKGT